MSTSCLFSFSAWYFSFFNLFLSLLFWHSSNISPITTNGVLSLHWSCNPLVISFHRKRHPSNWQSRYKMYNSMCNQALESQSVEKEFLPKKEAMSYAAVKRVVINLFALAHLKNLSSLLRVVSLPQQINLLMVNSESGKSILNIIT